MIQPRRGSGDASTERLLTAVFMSMPSAVAITDEKLDVVTANSSFLRLLGMASSQIEGHDIGSVIAFSDRDATINALRGGPGSYATTARIRTRGTLPVTITTVNEPGFKQFRIVSIAEQPAAAPPPKHVVVAGKIQLIGLEEVRTALGARWQSHADRVLAIAERAIRRRLTPQDVCLPTADSGFVIRFAEGTEDEAALRAAAIAREVRDTLIGESEDIERAAVTAVTQSIEVDQPEKADDPSFYADLEHRLLEAAKSAEGRARDDLRELQRTSKLDLSPLFDRDRRPVPILYAGRPRPMQDRIDRALSIIPPSKAADYDFDVLLLTEVGEAVLEQQRQGLARAVVVPLDYAVCATKRRLDAYVRACRALHQTVRQSLIFVITNLPKNLAQSRLQELVALLQPFAKMVGVAPAELDAVPTDLINARIGMVVFQAARLADWSRSEQAKIRRICQRIQVSNVRLLAVDARTEADAEFSRRLGADFITYEGDPASLPKSALLAKFGKGPAQNLLKSIPYTALAQASDAAVVLVDATQPDYPIVMVNDVFQRITGYAEEEVIGRNPRFLQGPDTDRAVVAEIRQAIEHGEIIRREILNYRKDGSTFWFRLVLLPVRGPDGRILAYASIQPDVTQSHAAEAAQRRLTKLVESIVDNVPGYVFQRANRFDGTIDHLYISRSLLRIIGAPEGTKVSDALLRQIILPDDREAVDHAYRTQDDTVARGIEFRIITMQGEIRWIRSRANHTRNANGDVIWSGVGIDITDEKEALGRATYLTQFDPLTGCHNISSFRTDLALRVEQTATDASTILFLVEIVGLAEITEAYGVPAGDDILRMMPRRLAAICRSEPQMYRLSGNQFAVMDSTTDPESTAETKADELCRALSVPFPIGTSGEVMVDIRLGVAIASAAPGHRSPSDHAREFEKQANVALSEAKRDRRRRFALYRPELDDRMRNEVILKQSLRSAIDQEQLELYYQPLVALATGRIIGAEALIRWRHPTFGLQRPDQFIPLAEETGLIVPMGEWILNRALKDVREFTEAGATPPRIAVNISGVQLSHGNLIETVERALGVSGVDPGRLELELTETYLIDYSADVMATLSALRKLGITIAIDDFGAGYSSFQYLRRMPVDKIKIDQIFVRNLVENSSDLTILQAMVTMGIGLGLTVVVEGVETEFQRKALYDLGCSVAQGYYFSVPLAKEDFLWLLGQDVPLPLSLSEKP